jgi:hypothetical protein
MLWVPVNLGKRYVKIGWMGAWLVGRNMLAGRFTEYTCVLDQSQSETACSRAGVMQRPQ